MSINRMSMLVCLALMPGALSAYPHTYTNCGVTHTITEAPQRIITMNQGATEFLLALGLADRMVATAWLDDAIWPAYKSAYDTIGVVFENYPTEAEIMALNPDMIVASYNSAFRTTYTTDSGTRGIFTNATVGPCEGSGSDWGDNVWNTCRPQLNAANISTYLFADACEDSSLRPETVSEDVVYQELRDMGNIFDVEVESVITEMLEDFDSAAEVLNTIVTDAPLKALWFDCVGCCGGRGSGSVFVGAGTGAPQMLMTESGLTNAFADMDGNWVCVNISQVAAAAPDVIVLVDAGWDTAEEKITWLYNQTEFCNMDFLTSARFVTLPFSATTLGPRNGQAALDMALSVASMRAGTEGLQGSGVQPYDTMNLVNTVADLKCNFDSAATSTFATVTTTTTVTTVMVDAATPLVAKLFAVILAVVL